jgi:predicted DsbA family dithiol-disulfide isomerase
MKITVYSDFVCPFCFLGKQTLHEAVKDKDVEIEWKPFELRPEGTQPLSPKSQYIQQGWKMSVKPLADRLGVKMMLPEMDPHPRTQKTHEGFQFAKERGKGKEYVEAVFQAFWQEGKDIGNVDVLASIAEEVGLEREKFTEALQNGDYAQAHQVELQHAYREANVTAVPTIIIGNRKLQGVQPKEVLEQVIAEQSTGHDDHSGQACGIDACE